MNRLLRPAVMFGALGLFSVPLSLLVFAQAPVGKTDVLFEYKVFDTPPTVGTFSPEPQLNQLAMQGWDLVFVTPLGPSNQRYILKRVAK